MVLAGLPVLVTAQVKLPSSLIASATWASLAGVAVHLPASLPCEAGSVEAVAVGGAAPSADGGTADGALSLLVDDQGTAREGRADGPGVAGIECLRERLDQGPDGPGVVRAVLLWSARVLSSNAQAGPQERQADHQRDRFHARSFPSGIDYPHHSRTRRATCGQVGHG